MTTNYKIDVHQTDNTTQHNRYPEIFARTAEVFKERGMVPNRLLSFGCSSGEEVMTLAETYFPSSQIVGVDVAQSFVDAAQEKNFLAGRTIYTPCT
ncbi:MAG: hypothetical protein WCD70_12270 [Alphaproteobacteria bacterium]